MFALNVGQWCSFAQKWRTTMCCTFWHLYECFAWEVWFCVCLCVLTGHAVFFIDITRWAFFGAAGDQHVLKSVCQWPTFLGKCLSMTNIFFKNVCQWPTFLEKCLSMTDISWKNVCQSPTHWQLVNDVHFPLHTYSPLWMFFFQSLRLWSLGRSHPSLDKPSAIFAASGDQHFLKNVCHWPTFLL